MKFKNLTTALFFASILLSNEPLINERFFTKFISRFKLSMLNKHLNPLRAPQLKNLPKCDELGVVKESFLLHVNDAFAPYNPSAIFDGKNYEIVFRQDIINIDKNFKGPYKTYIKKVLFDKNFNQISPTETLIKDSSTAEDPRLINNSGEKILVFNDLRDKEKSKSRIINYCNISSDNATAIPLELGFNLFEKNWSPFFKNEKLHFVYQVIPHKVLAIDSENKSQVISCPQEFDFRDFSFWKWGEPRGGTPALEFNGDYISFFHSYFKHNNRYIYVMGAYTFEKDAPFRIKKITPFPIIFKDIYSAKFQNTSDSTKSVIYPSGIVYDDKNNEFVVFCGENDCAIRVLQIDAIKLDLIMDELDNLSKKFKKKSN